MKRATVGLSPPRHPPARQSRPLTPGSGPGSAHSLCPAPVQRQSIGRGRLFLLLAPIPLCRFAAATECLELETKARGRAIIRPSSKTWGRTHSGSPRSWAAGISRAFGCVPRSSSVCNYVFVGEKAPGRTEERDVCRWGAVPRASECGAAFVQPRSERSLLLLFPPCCHVTVISLTRASNCCGPCLEFAEVVVASQSPSLEPAIRTAKHASNTRAIVSFGASNHHVGPVLSSYAAPPAHSRPPR